jgi:hypothetical protein
VRFAVLAVNVYGRCGKMYFYFKGRLFSFSTGIEPELVVNAGSIVER